jgi:hypothetical protein
MTAYYLYAFTTPTATSAPLRGVAGGTLEVIASSQLGVIAEAVDARAFEADWREHQDQAQWLANLAVRHDAIINAHLECGALPLRFGTLLEDRASVLALLESNAGLRSRLDALRGRREYAVRVWAVTDRMERKLLESHATLADVHAEMQAASSGKRYLLERRYRDALQTSLRETLPELRSQASMQLDALVEASVVLERTPKAQGTEIGVLEAAVLLEEARVETLRESLATWLETMALRAELTGPFAPYNFAQTVNEVQA